MRPDGTLQCGKATYSGDASLWCCVSRSVVSNRGATYDHAPMFLGSSCAYAISALGNSCGSKSTQTPHASMGDTRFKTCHSDYDSLKTITHYNLGRNTTAGCLGKSHLQSTHGLHAARKRVKLDRWGLSDVWLLSTARLRGCQRGVVNGGTKGFSSWGGLR